jgi:hypothetical protein
LRGTPTARGSRERLRSQRTTTRRRAHIMG